MQSDHLNLPVGHDSRQAVQISNKNTLYRGCLVSAVPGSTRAAGVLAARPCKQFGFANGDHPGADYLAFLPDIARKTGRRFIAWPFRGMVNQPHKS